MIFDTMLPARVPSSIGVPDIQYLQHTSGSTFKLGAILVYNTGEVEEAGTNPTTGIVGISLAPAGQAPGYNAANSPVVSTGRQRKVAVARANRQTVFLAGCVNNSSTRITPLISYVGNQYGVTKHGNNWFVDINKSGANQVVRVVGYDDMWGTNGGLYFKFLESTLATP
jgi:hypothetical protein